MRRPLTSFAIATAIAAAMAHTIAPLSAISNSIVISQVYGGGGNAGATLKNDFIELLNRGTSPQSLNGWSVQYAAAAGTGWQATPLTNVTLQPG
jgi:predicted extracellular nuclease